MKCLPQQVIVAVGLIAMCAGTAAALTDAEKCEAAKNKIAGKYALCLQRAHAKAIKTGRPLDVSKCDTKFTTKWGTAETRGGNMCPTNGDQAAIQDQLTADSDFIALELAGVRFVGNGDGTVTDTQTGLMWEKKDDSGGLHDKDDTYTWADAMSEFISEVNGHSNDGTTQAGLGGHSDWRLPTHAELRTILLKPYYCDISPCIDSAFGPTVASFYWSSISPSIDPTKAWYVNFYDGLVFGDDKTVAYYVRAVRGGT